MARWPYNTKRWKQLQAGILRRDKYLCQWCLKQDRTTALGQQPNDYAVHHIKSVKKHPELVYDPDNLVSICRECHDAHHGCVVAISVKGYRVDGLWGAGQITGD
jgi:5-methylcytosine-specific restriction protein A